MVGPCCPHPAGNSPAVPHPNPSCYWDGWEDALGGWSPRDALVSEDALCRGGSLGDALCGDALSPEERAAEDVFAHMGRALRLIEVFCSQTPQGAPWMEAQLMCVVLAGALMARRTPKSTFPLATGTPTGAMLSLARSRGESSRSQRTQSPAPLLPAPAAGGTHPGSDRACGPARCPPC